MTIRTIPESALVDAAVAVAGAFGLGDLAEVGKSWLVDDGDTVIVAELEGDVTGQLMLAVNDDVARRLTSDPARLAAGLELALAPLAATLGITLALGETSWGAAIALPEPTHRVEIRDNGKLCALLGCTLDGGEPEPEPDPAPDAVAPGTAAPFTPTPFGGGAPTANPALAGLGPLALLQDVDMEVTVELGRTTMPIRDLLALQPGMVVEIDRVAGAPIDVLVNGHRFACGEVVVIDEEFGLRITEIVGAN